MRIHRLLGIALTATATILVPAAADACCRIKKPRITVKKPRVTVKEPRVTVGTPRVTVGSPRVTIGTPRITIGQPTVVVGKPLDTIEDVVQRTGKGIGRPLGEVISAGGQVATNVYRAGADAGGDTLATVGKAHDDAVAEAGRAVENVEELGTALRRYAVAAVTDTTQTISDAEKRVREGKFADAFWHAAVDPLKGQEQRAAQLAQESSLANTVGAVAASAYGGPGGAAAYSAWYAYRASGGDIELALKAGVISGATSAGLSAVGGMPVDAANPAPDIAKKAIVAGAIGGLAVAAAGGDGDALRDGFIRSGGMVLIQDGYKQFTGGHSLPENTKAPTQGAFCTLSVPAPGTSCAPPREWFKLDENGNFVRNANGEPILDVSKIDPRYSYVGLASSGEGNWLISENGPVMEGVAQVPGLNAMAIFHDQWVITAPLTGWTNQATIFPAIVVTYLGTEAGIQNAIQEAIQRKRSNQPTESQSQATGDSGAEDAYLCAGEVEVSRSVRTAGFPPRIKYVPTTVVDTRSIFVVNGDAPSQFACAVIYQKGGKDYLPYYAENDPAFCAPKAAEIVINHVNSGWTCFTKEPVVDPKRVSTRVKETASVGL